MPKGAAPFGHIARCNFVPPVKLENAFEMPASHLFFRLRND
jgi:hypothetical protein